MADCWKFALSPAFSVRFLQALLTLPGEAIGPPSGSLKFERNLTFHPTQRKKIWINKENLSTKHMLLELRDQYTIIPMYLCYLPE